jgi:hypothetical protein
MELCSAEHLGSALVLLLLALALLLGLREDEAASFFASGVAGRDVGSDVGTAPDEAIS